MIDFLYYKQALEVYLLTVLSWLPYPPSLQRSLQKTHQSEVALLHR